MTISRTEVVTLINECMALQDKFNTIVNPQWRKANYPWWRAAWLETAELVDHGIPWKWWKKTTPDREQALLELVDIFHFMLSADIEKRKDGESVAASYTHAERHVKRNGDEEYVLTITERFVDDLVNHRMQMNVFMSVVVAMDFTLQNILKLYLAKNTLNLFRQDNGYKTGEYIKVWNGKEDNVHLMEIVAPFDVLNQATIYQELKARYDSLTPFGN